MNITQHAPCIWTMQNGTKVHGFVISVGPARNGALIITGETEHGSLFVTPSHNVEIIPRERKPERVLPPLISSQF
jgi:hypothetical protein